MRTLRRIVAFILLGLVVVAWRSPHNPFVERIPGRDSGVYLYLGSQIVQGALPYRDAWDNKPPAIYYIDALGLALSRGAVWGVWIFQMLAFVLAAWFGFAVLDGAFGRLPALFGSITWVLGSVFVLKAGNLTEEFALPLQFCALYLFFESERQRRLAWRGAAIGATLGLAFLLRQNLVAVHLAILAYLLWPGASGNRVDARWLDAAMICLAAAGVILAAGLYLAVRGAMPAFLDAAFRFNVVYHASSPRQILRAVFDGIRQMARAGLPIIALAAWVARILGHGRRASAPAKAVINVALIGLPISLMLASLSGKTGSGYGHYYIAWLPIFAVLAGVFAYDSAEHLGHTVRRLWKWDLAASSVWVICLTLVMGLMPLAERFRAAGAAETQAHSSVHAQAVELIRRTTAARDSVLVWGFEPSVNFLAHRRSPTRFVYQLPLYVDGYQNPQMIDGFFNDLTTKRPVLIIDASSSSADVTPPIDPVGRRTWEPSARIRVPAEMDRVFEHITSNYRRVAELNDGQVSWAIYRDRRRLTVP
jgi:hypothetical protein